MSILSKHLLNGCLFWHQTPDLNALDKVPTLLPFPILKCLASLHDMITRAFWGTCKHLAVGEVQESPERLRNSLALLFLVVNRGQEWDLDEHAGDKECSL